MVVIQPGNRRIIRKIAEQEKVKGKALFKKRERWEVGDPSAPLPFNHFGGFDDITTAILNHEQCVLRALSGMDPNLYIPAPRNCPTFDDKALRAVRTLKQKIKEKIEDIEESIKAAKKKNVREKRTAQARDHCKGRWRQGNRGVVDDASDTQQIRQGCSAA